MPSIAGRITTRDVLLHGPTIVLAFGPLVYCRCIRAIVLRRQTTFLTLAVRIAPEVK